MASDVRRVLGVAQSGSNFSFLSPEEVRPIPRGLASGKGMAQARVLSESGLYKFVLRSDKAQARAFQDWVTRVVLPAIRKDGAYIMGEEKVATGEISAEELAARVVDALGAKGIMGDVVNRLEAIGRRLALEDQKPQFFARELKAAGYALPRGPTKKPLLAADKLERLPRRQEN